MAALFTVIVLAFVILVLGLAGFALFELTPFARSTNEFRTKSGQRIGHSPHLD